MQMEKEVIEWYDFERPARAREVVVVSEYGQAKKSLEERETLSSCLRIGWEQYPPHTRS